MIASPIITQSARTAAKQVIRKPVEVHDNIIYRNIGDAAIAWIEAEFHVPELRGPLRLEPYQKAAIREAYRTDAAGKFVYSIIVWSDLKKSIKSTIAAAVALERARRLEWGSIKIVANDLKQADSRVSFYARRAIELNKTYFANWKMKPSGYQIITDQHSTIEAIPVDPKGEAGGNDDLIVFSELWAANQMAAQRMWTEMTLSPTKYGYSQRWVETYAGFSGESPLLEQLYETGVKGGRQLDLSYSDDEGYHDLSTLEIFANGRMLCLWNTVPRCLDWQTPEYYAQEAATLLPGEFNRVHRNQWATSAATFVPSEWWDACKGDYPPFDARTPMVVGMDAGVSSDTFALVGVSRLGDTTYKRLCRVYRPPKGGKVDFGDPEKFIREELVKNFNVVQICYDPYQLHDLATRLRADSVAWMYEFTQGQPRLEADKQLYDTIRDRRLVHDGDPMLTEHVKNANAKAEGEIDKLRIVKRAEHLKIDACVALSMANSEARRLNL